MTPAVCTAIAFHLYWQQTLASAIRLSFLLTPEHLPATMNLHCMLTFLVCSLSILTSLYRLYVCLQFLSCPFVRNGGEVVVVMRQHVVNFLRECLRSHEDLAMAADEASFCVMKGRIIRELTCLSVLVRLFAPVFPCPQVANFDSVRLVFASASTCQLCAVIL